MITFYKLARNRKRGFTLIEVLVAVAILLVGVVAALYIFPPGFGAFQNTQTTDVAIKLVQKYADDLQKNPDNIPDAIIPIDTSYSLTNAEVGTFFNDTNAIDFINNTTPLVAASPRYNWLQKHMLKTPSAQWPLWQPLSARIMRMVVGEKIKISSETANVGTSTNLIQKYTPLFSPLVPNADWNDTSKQYTSEPLAIYDLRYNRVATADELAVSGKLNYMIDYTTGIATLNTETYPRKIRVTFLVIDVSTNKITQYPTSTTSLSSPAVASLTSSGNTINLKSYYTSTVNTKIIPGSEIFNRAYEYVPYVNSSTITSLTTGQYSFEPPDPQTNLLFGNIYFSRADTGKTVKIDYQVADWGILHEDVAVDNNGYLKLSVQNPKIAGNPNPPREPSPWGLFTPVNLSATNAASVVQNNTVMAIVDMQTGQVYEVIFDPNHFVDDFNKALTPIADIGPGFDAGWKASQKYKLVPASYNPANWTATMRDNAVRTDQLKLIDMTNAEKGVLRVGAGKVTDKKSWQALRGRTLRVYYRAARDWTLQIIRPPAQFWSQSTTPSSTVSLGWNRFNATSPNIIYVPGVYAGMQLAVDYQTEDTTNYDFAIATATASVTNNTTISVNSTTGITAGMEIQLIDNVDKTKRPVRIVSSVISSTQFTITTPLSVSNGSIFVTPFSASMALCSLKQIGANIIARTVKYLKVGTNYEFCPKSGSPNERYIVTINSISTGNRITYTPLDPTAIITIVNGDTLMPMVTPSSTSISSNETHGEIHAVPQPDSNTGASKIILRKNFKTGSIVTIRGVSVTVRAFWIQERSGSAYQVDGLTEPPTSRTIGERWNTKSVDMVLPESSR